MCMCVCVCLHACLCVSLVFLSSPQSFSQHLVLIRTNSVEVSGLTACPSFTHVQVCVALLYVSTDVWNAAVCVFMHQMCIFMFVVSLFEKIQSPKSRSCESGPFSAFRRLRSTQKKAFPKFPEEMLKACSEIICLKETCHHPHNSKRNVQAGV